jgi:hypothetical protein
LALIESAAWLYIAVCAFPTLPLIDQDPDKVDCWWNAVVMFLAWTYCAYRPLRRPKPTPLYDIFVFHIILGVLRVLHLSRYVYATYVYHAHPFRNPLFISATTLDLTVFFASLYITFTTHIAHPGPESGLLRKDDGSIRNSDGQLVSPEDYTTLWKWITFAWVTPVTKQKDLSYEDDVWNMSPLMATRAIYSKYVEVGKQFHLDGKVTPSQFIWHLWMCNSLDIILEFIISSLGILSQFAQPLFLKIILDCISDFTSPQHPLTVIEICQLRANVVIYALLYFVAMVFKSLFNLHMLWHGRRAGTRARNQIMIWIYEKALRRRDIISPGRANRNKDITPKSGAQTPKATTDDQSNLQFIPAANENGGDEEGREDVEVEVKEEEADADLGKVVNLMSTDVETIGEILARTYDYYVCLVYDFPHFLIITTPLLASLRS